MEVIGKIKVINAEQQVSASFKKRELVVTTEEQYPQHIMIEFTQDKCDLLNNYKAGEPVKVSINLRGREWVNPQGETKYFNSIQGWRIEKMASETPGQSAPMPAAQAFEPANDFKEEDHDDLPF
jgi:translation initiation factor IF-3